MKVVKRKIGTNRGTTRIWLEGKTLAEAGWRHGDTFDVEFGDGFITYRKRAGGKRKVAGGSDRPVIDTNTAKIADSVGTESVSVTIEADKITISK